MEGSSKQANGGIWPARISPSPPPAPAAPDRGSGATGNSLVPDWYPQDMAMYLERIVSTRKDARAPSSGVRQITCS